MMYGYIKLFRSITEHWLFPTSRPFTKFEAFIYMVMRANFKPNKVMLGNEVLNVNRGEFITSQKKLMETFSWGKSKLIAFLKLLDKEEMIEVKADKKMTKIIISNYEKYQDAYCDNEPNMQHVSDRVNKSKNHKQTSYKPPIDHSRFTSKPQSDTENNVNNLKNDNQNKTREVVYPFSSKDFKKNWENWKLYLTEIKKSYKSGYSEQAALHELSEMAGNEENANKIIIQAMSRGWRGLFPIKNKTNGKTESNSGLQEEIIGRIFSNEDK